MFVDKLLALKASLDITSNLDDRLQMATKPEHLRLITSIEDTKEILGRLAPQSRLTFFQQLSRSQLAYCCSNSETLLQIWSYFVVTSAEIHDSFFAYLNQTLILVPVILKNSEELINVLSLMDKNHYPHLLNQLDANILLTLACEGMPQFVALIPYLTESNKTLLANTLTLDNLLALVNHSLEHFCQLFQHWSPIQSNLMTLLEPYILEITQGKSEAFVSLLKVLQPKDQHILITNFSPYFLLNIENFDQLLNVLQLTHKQNHIVLMSPLLPTIGKIIANQPENFLNIMKALTSSAHANVIDQLKESCSLLVITYEQLLLIIAELRGRPENVRKLLAYFPQDLEDNFDITLERYKRMVFTYPWILTQLAEFFPKNVKSVFYFTSSVYAIKEILTYENFQEVSYEILNMKISSRLKSETNRPPTTEWTALSRAIAANPTCFINMALPLLLDEEFFIDWFVRELEVLKSEFLSSYSKRVETIILENLTCYLKPEHVQTLFKKYTHSLIFSNEIENCKHICDVWWPKITADPAMLNAFLVLFKTTPVYDYIIEKLEDKHVQLFALLTQGLMTDADCQKQLFSLFGDVNIKRYLTDYTVYSSLMSILCPELKAKLIALCPYPTIQDLFIKGLSPESCVSAKTELAAIARKMHYTEAELALAILQLKFPEPASASASPTQSTINWLNEFKIALRAPIGNASRVRDYLMSSICLPETPPKLSKNPLPPGTISPMRAASLNLMVKTLQTMDLKLLREQLNQPETTRSTMHRFYNAVLAVPEECRKLIGVGYI